MGRRARKLVLLSLVGLSRGFAPRPDAATLRCDTRASSVAAGDAAAVESMRSARLDAVEDAEDMRKIFEAGADVQLTVEQEMELEDKTFLVAPPGHSTHVLQQLDQTGGPIEHFKHIERDLVRNMYRLQARPDRCA